MFSFGSSGDGKLGRAGKDSFKAEKVDIDLEIAAIGAGCDHSVVIDLMGRAFAWGFGQHGATGTGRLATEQRPAKVDVTSEQLVRVWCGTDFSLFESKI